MGKLTGGPFGPVLGRIGNLVSYSLNGRNVIRKIGKRKKKSTILQLAARQRLSVTTTFLKPTLGFINLGFMFKTIGTERNAHNEAVSYNSKHALIGEYPNIAVDYSKLVLAMGNLFPPDAPTAAKVEGDVSIQWNFDVESDWDYRNDRAMVLLFYPDSNTAVYNLSGAQRSEGTQFISLPSTL